MFLHLLLVLAMGLEFKPAVAPYKVIVDSTNSGELVRIRFYDLRSN